ncbi:MAG: class I SAM-dependent methyltransferase [Venatoribacter sp.]
MPRWEATQLQLECWPSVPEHIARAWDSADELLLSAYQKDKTTLLLNDRYGALLCAIPSAHVWADSAMAMASSQRNLARNQLTATGEFFLQEEQIPNSITQVLIKVPKQFELLQFWLAALQQRLPSHTQYHLAGMVKHWPVSWLNWLEQHGQDYQQSLISKKARRVTFTLAKAPPAPKNWLGYSYQGVQFEALPGVFSRDKLDIGSRVLLSQPLQLTGSLCDLGCGNGLLGISLAKRHALTEVHLTDDSFLALRSAQKNAQAAGVNAQFYHANSLDALTKPVDWIVCNPPFHDGHKELTQIAQTMFEQSASKLNKNGKLLVIANRHLPYLPMLRRLFKQVDSIGEDKKFSLYLCNHTG